jgi:hypothetical protein
MIFEMRVLGFESHFPKLAERMRGTALYPAKTVPTAPMCSFQNVVVNNEADLWIITRLALANDELGAIIGRCRMVSMQAESRLSTNPVLLHKPTPNTASETVARFRSVADPACSRVQRGRPRTAGRSGELSCRPNPQTVQIPYAQPAIVQLAGNAAVR